MSEQKKMSSVEKARKRRDGKNVAFLRFAHKYSPHKKIPFCFVEGEDSVYYRGIISALMDDTPEFIKCGGKKGVLEVAEELERHPDYDIKKLLFFIDRDFDKEVNKSHIYETPYYSIENLYVKENVLGRILKDQFSIDEDDEDFQKVLENFNARKEEYHESITPLNAWIKCCHEISESRGEKVNLSLGSLSFSSHLIEVSLNLVKSKYTIESIKKITGVDVDIPEQNLSDKYEEFGGIGNKDEVFRGKFELEFFKTILNKYIEDRNKKEERVLFREKGKVSLHLGSDILTVLSGYAEIPQCLRTYLHSKKEYIYDISS